MSSKTITLLFSICAFGLGLAIPAFAADERCGPNAIFMECGTACEATCNNPQPPPYCIQVCVTGCFCKQGYLKNENGQCVRPHECDAQIHHKIPLQIPSTSQTCPANEEFLACGSACVPTCANPQPSPVCTKNCVVGCFCKQGHLRNSNGVCVPANQCEQTLHRCGENEEYRQCKGCDGTCDHPNPMCPRICIPGCACKRGYLRAAQNGKCIPKEECPKVDALQTSMTAPECPSNEVFQTCGTACPATCAKPHPSPVCTKNCVIGCFCKQGYLRNAKGVCVPAANCDATEVKKPEPQCVSDREFYVDECGSQLDCMSTCHTPPAFLVRGVPQIPKKCAQLQCKPACVCKHPYVRNVDGTCVHRNECGPIYVTTPSTHWIESAAHVIAV